MIRFFRRPDVEVLVLCTANICRSPAAEGLLRDALRRRGLHRRVRVRSAGTGVGVPGTPPDPRMVSIAAEIGVSLRGLRAAPLNEELLRKATVVYAMEPAHLAAIDEIVPGFDGHTELLDPGGEAVEDPYFGDKAGVRRVFERLRQLSEDRALQWQRQLASADRIK